MNCKYLNIIMGEYSCSLDMLIAKTLINSTKIAGNHLDGKSDDDVVKIFLESRTYSYSFPSIICEKFKFLKSVDTSNSLIQFIQENSLKSCTNLEQLMLFNDDDVELPENLFFYNTKLTSLKLILNSMQTLSKNLLKNQNQTLKVLDLQIKSGNFLFPWDFFNDLGNLFTLKLSIAGLKILDPKWFKKLINLEINKFSVRNFKSNKKDFLADDKFEENISNIESFDSFAFRFIFWSQQFVSFGLDEQQDSFS